MFIVISVSDWDGDRANIITTKWDSLDNAKKQVAGYLKSLKATFLDEDEYCIEEEPDGTGYYCYCGTNEEPQPSLGWEKCEIVEV